MPTKRQLMDTVNRAMAYAEKAIDRQRAKGKDTWELDQVLKLLEAKHDTSKHFQVVFKAGYEVEAQNKDKAIKTAEEQLRDEYAERGISLFVTDVHERSILLFVANPRSRDPERDELK